jgi:hypothetical protein
MATAGDQINGALRLIGQLAEGETPSAETSADALTALNQMLDSWSAQRLHVFSTQDQTFTWNASIATRTLGPSGDFVGNRPVMVDDATYFKVNNLSYPLQLVNEDQYNSIALKGSTSTYPGVMWVNMNMPDITMTIYPVPTMAIEMHIISVVEMTEPASLATELVIPPGYLRAYRFNLACELAAEFGVEPSPRVKRVADTSLRAIKRINNPRDMMSMPYSLMSHRRGNFNIFTGNVN